MKKNTKLILALVALFIVLSAGIFYLSGFRLTSGLKIERAGSIEITNLSEGTEIFINGRKKKRINSNEDSASFMNISKGQYSVLVALPNNWPWTKNITIEKGKKVFLKPFFVPINSSGFIIGKEDLEYDSIIKSINRISPPNVNNKITSENNLVSVWVEGQNIMAGWLGEVNSAPRPFCRKENSPMEKECQNELIVFNSSTLIRNVRFFKGRDDVIVLGIPSGIFALEIDDDGTRNFQPIYKGGDVNFLEKGKNILYVRDADNILQVNF